MTEVFLTDAQYQALVDSAHNWLDAAAGVGATFEVEFIAIIALLALLCGLVFASILTRRWGA